MQTPKKNVTTKDLAVWLKQGMSLDELFQKLQSYSTFPLCSEDDLKSFLKKALKKSNVDRYIREFKKNKVKLSPKRKNQKTRSDSVSSVSQEQQENEKQEKNKQEAETLDAPKVQPQSTTETNETYYNSQEIHQPLKENLEDNMSNKQKTDERAEKLFSLNELLNLEETLKRNIINITERELLPQLHDLEKENAKLKADLKNNLSQMESVLNKLEGYKKSLERQNSKISEIKECIKSLTEVNYTFFSCNTRENVLSFEDVEISKNQFEDSYLEILTEGVDREFLDKLSLGEIKMLAKALVILKNKINEVEKVRIYIFTKKEDIISNFIASYFPNVEFCYVEGFEES